MHGDEIKGTELSSAFDMQLEIKFIDNAPLTRLDCWSFDGRARLGSTTQVVGNHEGSVLKIA
jgi:hypothetical protein